MGRSSVDVMAASEPEEDDERVTDGALAVPDRPKGVATFTPEQVEAARSYTDASRAASTRAKYLQHWTAFGRWCQKASHRPLSAEPAVVAVHLSGLAAAGTAPQTLALRMAAIGYVHRQAGEVPPHKVRGGSVILDILACARRSWGKPPARKAAADSDLIWSMLHEVKGDSLRDVRDRALLSFGMVSCLRRSELAALDVSDLVRAPESLRVTIRRFKTDQEGAAATIAVSAGRWLKPLAHLDAWLARAAITENPLFRRLSAYHTPCPRRFGMPACCKRRHASRRLSRSRAIQAKTRRTAWASSGTTSKRATPPPCSLGT